MQVYALIHSIYNHGIHRIIEIERCYAMEKMWKTITVIRILKEPPLIQIMIDQKQLVNVEYFKYLGNTITNDARCTRVINFSTVTAKAAFSKKTLCTSKLDLNLRKKPVKCHIWSTALYGAETCTLRRVDQKNLKSSETWC